MDVLSEVLTLLKPRSFLTACLDAGGSWSIRSENRIGAIKCYAIEEGMCWLKVDGLDAPTLLSSGDCFVLPNGRSFTLASDLSLPPTPAIDVLGLASPGGIVRHNGGGDTTLIGTRFEVDPRRAAMLLAPLPPLMLLQNIEDQAILRWAITRIMAEMRLKNAGASLAAHHLAHLMLLQAFRLHLALHRPEGMSWFSGLNDPRVGRAIEAMHAKPAHRWTLDELAIEAGLSRSTFARRFRETVGDTPFAYLTAWRMMLATEMLSASRETLSKIAYSIGYDSENSFNTAFKRVMGCSPRRYVKDDVEEAGYSVT